MTAIRLLSPLSGRTVPLEAVPDPAFAGHMVGEGLAVDPTSDVLCAPCDGELLSIHRAGHACTLRADNGTEILLHIGVDTVALKGEGFTRRVADGTRVRAGDPLIGFDLAGVRRRAPSAMTILVVINGETHHVGRMVLGRDVTVGEGIATVDDLPVEEAAATPLASEAKSSTDSATGEVLLPIAHGLHARPAAALAALVRAHPGTVTVTCRGREANAKSVVALMGLGTTLGDRLSIRVDGVGAVDLVDVLIAAVASGLGDAITPVPDGEARSVDETDTPPFPADREVVLTGTTGVAGRAVGVALVVSPRRRRVQENGAGAAIERGRLESALAEVAARLDAAVATATGDRAAIFAAHRALVADPELIEAAHASVALGKSAEWAWRAAIGHHIDVLSGVGDARTAERAADLRDLETTVLGSLAGENPDEVFAGARPDSILVVEELLPSAFAALPDTGIAGIVMAAGGPTAHAVIMAAASGIPTIVAAGAQVFRIPDGAPLVLEADHGRLVVHPDPAALEAARSAAEVRRARRAANRLSAHEPCTTVDGHRIEIFANAGSTAEVISATAEGAEGVGLLRSEFLFMHRATAPGEDEQLAEYQTMADSLAGRPLVVRTLDVGGDKPIDWMRLPREENPALGLRGVRVSLRDPAVLRTQIRAILRVHPAGIARIMVPMISSLGELRAVRRIAAEEAAALGLSSLPQIGVMIEVPAAAMIADRLAAEADFLSIGTNDLTQYALAMDRGNSAVAAQVDALHPGVLALVGVTT